MTSTARFRIPRDPGRVLIELAGGTASPGSVALDANSTATTIAGRALYGERFRQYPDGRCDSYCSLQGGEVGVEPARAVSGTQHTSSAESSLDDAVPLAGNAAPFTTVEVEVNSRCNRRCGYCPVSLHPYPDVPRLMDRRVWARLLVELARLGFGGRLSYHFFNEPLLRRDLEELCAEAAAALPGSTQVIYTNGDLLSEERYHSLLAAGVDLFVVTPHGGALHPERPKQIVQYPAELRLTNRAGTLTHLPLPTAETRRRPCFAPSEMLIVGVSGDVHVCYEDSEREHLMGNIMQEPIDDIWFSAPFVRLREALRGGQRLHACSLCKNCSNVAHVNEGTSHRP